MSNNNYFIDGKIKLPYNFEKEKYIIGIEKKSDNTLVGSKTILPIKDALPNNKIEITPIFSPTFHFAYENNKFNIIKNELYFNINLIIDEIPISLKELNDENGLVVDWDEKYLIEKTNNPAEFKLSLKEDYTSISDTKSVLYNELINNGVFSESINVYIKYNDLYFNTKLDILFSKSYFEVASLYDTIDINSGVSENFITIDGYYNDTKVNKDDLSLTFKKNGENIFTNVISTLGFASLTKVKNEWVLHCEDSEKISSENKYQVSTGGTIVFNKQKVQYVYNENGEYFDLNSGQRVFLKEECSDESIVVYDFTHVIPIKDIVDPFNNIKINENVSFDSINNTIKDVHDRVTIPNNGEYYPINSVYTTRVINANNNYFYDKNGRLINQNLNDTLIIEGGLILSGLTGGTKILSGNTEVITNNEIVTGFENVITKIGDTFYYKNKILYANGKGYFNGEQVSNVCPLITDELGDVLYSVKQTNGKFYITDSSGNSFHIEFDKKNLQWRIDGQLSVFSVKNGELLYNGIVIGDTNGNLHRRHDLNLIDFKYANLVIDEDIIIDIYDGKNVESEIVNRDEVYYDAHSITEIKKSIPNLYAYLLSYNANNENTELPKINIEATYDGAMVDEKVFSISNGTLNHSSYGIKIEPQVITQSMIQNGGTVTAYIVNKSGEQIPHSTYSKNNYSFSYVFDNDNITNTVTSDTCTINLSTGNPVYNEIKFTLKCGNRTVKEEIVEVLGENRLITSVKYIDVTTGATYTITPSTDLYGNKINWTTGTGIITALTISAGDTTQKILSGYVNNVKIYEQTVIPVKNGNDGESPYTLALTNTNASISCDSDGNILNGTTMPTCQAILYKGTEKVDRGVKYVINPIPNVSISETNGTISFNSGFTFTGNSLEIAVSASTTIDNVLRGKAIMTITKAKQGEKGDTGASGDSAVSYWMEITPNTLKKIGNDFLIKNIKISKWKKKGTDSPISITGGIVYLYHEASLGPFAAITGTTYTIPTGFNRNTLTFKWADGTGTTDIVYDVQTIPILKDGENGEKGDRGKLLYPAGRWDSGITYIGTDNEKTPFVVHKVGDVDKYYVLTANKNTTSGDTPGSSTAWTEMAQYEALYTKLLVAENGLVGGSVYNGDYVFSKDGVLSGNNTNEYSGFTSEIVDSVFTGGTATDKFVPNYLVDFNKGRAWFGNGNTLINEKGVLYTNNLVEDIVEYTIPWPSGSTANGWDATVTGYAYTDKNNYEFIEPKDTVYIRNIFGLNIFLKDITRENVCPGEPIKINIYIPPEIILQPNKFYKGTIYLSKNCASCKIITFPAASFVTLNDNDKGHNAIMATGSGCIDYLAKWDGETYVTKRIEGENRFKTFKQCDIELIGDYETIKL